jgi:hypothetical protein
MPFGIWCVCQFRHNPAFAKKEGLEPSRPRRGARFTM